MMITISTQMTVQRTALGFSESCPQTVPLPCSIPTTSITMQAANTTMKSAVESPNLRRPPENISLQPLPEKIVGTMRKVSGTSL